MICSFFFTHNESEPVLLVRKRSLLLIKAKTEYSVVLFQTELFV